MKNKFILALTLIAMLGNYPSFAMELENLDILDYEILTSGCAQCGSAPEVINLQEKYIKNHEGSTTRCKKHEDCDYKVIVDYNNGLKYAYSSKESLEADLNKNVDVLEIGDDTNYTTEMEREHNSIKNSALKSYKNSIAYEDIEISGNVYYVYEGLLEEIDLQKRNLYTEKDGIFLVTFDKDELDVYLGKENIHRVVLENRVPYKYEIMNYYNDGVSDILGAKTPNNSNLISNGADIAHFFVCDDCRKCKECDYNVAVNSSSSTDKIVLSNCCAKDTCAFIWVTSVGNNKNKKTEGLICKEKKGENSDYCDAHKCNVCNNPIIGSNMNMILTKTDKIFNYDGANEYGYSNYCIDDYCIEYCCRNMRDSKAGGKEYCSHHIKVCAYPGCTQTITNKWEGKYLCATHNKSALGTVKCNVCGSIFVGDKCLYCKLEMVIYDALSEVAKKDGIEVENRNVPTEYFLWQNMSGILDENLIKIEENALKNCTHGEKSWYTVVQNLVGTQYHIIYTICRECDKPIKKEKIIHTYVEGICKCGAKEGGEAENVESLQPTINFTIKRTVAIRINPVMSYNKCRHNHPILGDIKITKKSSSVHTQEWICAGCNKELSQDFNHTYLSNGKCICEIL